LLLNRVQLEHVEMPRSVIYVETAVDHIAAIAIVNLGPHQISQTHWLAAKFREAQRQPALPLAVGIIDDDEVAGARIANPGIGNKVVGGPVAAPAHNAGIVWVSAPGDYATFNSNHTPDGTLITVTLRDVAGFKTDASRRSGLSHLRKALEHCWKSTPSSRMRFANQ
jgi:hypothetical protein